MDELVEFFIKPYIDRTSWNIVIEVVAMSFGILSVWMAKRNNILVYPFGIISTLLYIYITALVTLYGEVIIYVYYTAMSAYGWILWMKKSDNKAVLQIAKSKKQDFIFTVLIFIFSSLFIISIYIFFEKFESFISYMDILTTGIFFSAMYLMAKKKIEHWWLWIIGNIISIPLYVIKELGISSLQFLIFLILAFYGLYNWKKELQKIKEHEA